MDFRKTTDHRDRVFCWLLNIKGNQSSYEEIVTGRKLSGSTIRYFVSRSGLDVRFVCEFLGISRHRTDIPKLKIYTADRLIYLARFFADGVKYFGSLRDLKHFLHHFNLIDESRNKMKIKSIFGIDELYERMHSVGRQS